MKLLGDNEVSVTKLLIEELLLKILFLLCNIIRNILPRRHKEAKLCQCILLRVLVASWLLKI